MKQAVEFEDEYEGIDGAPVAAAFAEGKTNRYGSIRGLADEELADPDELERQVIAEQWGPVLALPVKSRHGWMQPAADESGHVDFGAFATVDFERIEPVFDKSRYREDKLREQLGDVLIMLNTVGERLPGKAKYLVMKYLRIGIIDLEHVVNEDMRALGRLYLRARRIQREIAKSQETRARARKAKARAFLAD